MSIKIIVYDKEEYRKEKATGDEKIRLFLYDANNYQYCKLEFWDKETAGTIIIPEKSDIIHKQECFGYYFVDNNVIFMDDSGIVNGILEKMKESEFDSSEEFLFYFLELLVSDEVEFLQRYEEKMTVVEESLMQYDGENISGLIIQYRKELQKLQSYYHQLMDVGEILEEKYPIFEKFKRRMERILAEVRELREYSLQIRELYQTQISVRQNKVMQLLTVVTTIFMPLNLLTGWYGMNFGGMAAVNWKYGYLVVILISIVLICLEIWYFKQKKWFL